MALVSFWQLTFLFTYINMLPPEINVFPPSNGTGGETEAYEKEEQTERSTEDYVSTGPKERATGWNDGTGTGMGGLTSKRQG